MPTPLATLADGAAGTAVFYATLIEGSPESGWEDVALLHLETAIKGATGLYHPFWAGLAGLGWAIDHLAPEGLSPEDDAAKDVDEAIEDVVGRPKWEWDFDLISGLVGYGLYGLARRHREAGARIVARAVKQLDAIKLQHGDGLRWLSPPESLVAEERADYPGGFYSLGASHGLAGVIGFVAQAQAAGIEEALCARLLEGASKELVSHASPLPKLITLSGERVEHRHWSGWCHGDLGASAALLTAATATQNAELSNSAYRFARSALTIPTHSTSTGLCHGAAGAGHLFNRWWQETGEEVFRAEAIRRLETSLAHALPDETGFLNGAAGIGLVLHAAVSGTTPTWDQVLLASPA